MIQAAVLIQPVPDLTQISVSKSQEKVFEKGSRLINPADRIALESALLLQDKNLLEVTTLCAAGPEGEKLLRETLALGSKRGCLIDDERISHGDPFVVARALAFALRKLNVPLVFAGPGQIGPRVSEEMKANLCIGVEAVSLDGGELKVGEDPIPLPAVLCVSGGFQPRMANPIKIMKAAKAEIVRWDVAALNLDPDSLETVAQSRRFYLPND
jgi:electron transfer flavoprotein alpha/beta subunit